MGRGAAYSLQLTADGYPLTAIRLPFFGGWRLNGGSDDGSGGEIGNDSLRLGLQLSAYRLPASGFAAKVAAHKLGKRRIMKTDSGFAAKPDSFHQLTSVAYGATSFPRKEAIE